MKNNLSDIFNMTELKRFIFKSDNLKLDYCKLIFEKNHQEASKIGLKLFDVCPFYLLLAYFFQLKEDKNICKLLEVLIGRVTMSSELALFLAREGLCIELVKVYLSTAIIKDYIYYLTKKELMVNGHIAFEESILDELDDWDLYNFALENEIELKKNPTVNYSYFLVHKYLKDNQCVSKEEYEETKEYLVKRTRVFKDLNYLIVLCDINHHKDYTTNCLIQFLRNGFNLDKAKEIYLYLNKPSESFNPLENKPLNTSNPPIDTFNLLKVLLSHLIASKDINLLTFALFLTYSHRKSFVNNYEISLIHLFLCRFFCFSEVVKDLFVEFDIKNNQFYNLFFVWSDLALVTDKKDAFMANKYIALLKDNLKTIEGTLKHFVEKGKIDHSVSLVKTHNKLKNELVFREITSNTLLGTSSTTLFSDLLGKDCSYLFKKLTVGDKKIIFKENVLTTLHGQEYPFTTFDQFFINPIKSVTDDEFHNWFKTHFNGH